MDIKRRLDLLLNLIRVTGEAADFDTVLEKALRLICEYLHWEYGEVWLPGGDQAVLRPASTYYDNGKSDQHLKGFKRASETYRFKRGAGLPGRVWASEQPEWISNLSELPEGVYLRAPHAENARLRAALSVPIVAAREVIAIFVFYTAAPEKIERDLIELVSAAAEQLGSVLLQKRTTEALRRSEARFRRVVEAAPYAMVMVDEKGTIVLVNPETEKLFGYTPTELVGQTVELLLPQSFRTQHTAYRHGFLARPEARAMGAGRDLFALHKDGREIPVEIGLSPIQMDDGQYVLAAIVDITARKQAEAVHSHLASIVKSSHDAIIGSTQTGTIVSWNQGAERLYGYPAREAIGQRLQGLIPSPEQKQAFATLLQNISRHTSGSHFETKHQRKDGTLVDVALTVSPVIVAPGKLTGVSTIARDISALKRVERERERAQQRVAFLAQISQLLNSSLDYERALTTLTNMTVPHIADWCAVYMQDSQNDALYQLAVAHVDPEKAAWAKSLLARHPPDPTASEGIYAVARTGKSKLYPEITSAMLEASARNEDHLQMLREIGFRSVMIVPLSIHERTLGVMLFVSTTEGRHYGQDDLSLAEELAQRAATAVDNARLYREAQRFNAELEKQVATRTAQLKEANKELEAFAYSVSHDLRSPLRAMDGFSRILVDDYAAQLPDGAAFFLKRIRHNARQMGELIDDLLTFSRLSREPIQKRVVELYELAQTVLANLRQEYPDRQVEVEIGNLPAVSADPKLLKQVLANLLHNAFKYTRRRETAEIEIGSKQTDDEIIYFVKDNGVGFDMRYVDKLFGVFQRLHRAEEYEGTGVGLATVQRIIHRHGGRVWAEAAENQGATFYFTLEGPEQ